MMWPSRDFFCGTQAVSICGHHRKSRYHTSKGVFVTMKVEKTKKLIKSIPATEYGPEHHIVNVDGKSYLITQDPIRQKFTLYRVCKDGYERLASDVGSPVKLSELANMNI